jgi:hypothetical protein
MNLYLSGRFWSTFCGYSALRRCARGSGALWLVLAAGCVVCELIRPADVVRRQVLGRRDGRTGGISSSGGGTFDCPAGRAP